MYIKRTVEKTILEVAKSFPCIVLYGPRQVGKSTTLDYIFPESFNRVTLDNLEDRSIARQNPRLFLESNPWPVIIDEIQKVPELLDAIKIEIDKQRKIWLKNNEERKEAIELMDSKELVDEAKKKDKINLEKEVK